MSSTLDVFNRRDDRDTATRRLDDAARKAWADEAKARRWTLWMLLSFARPVDEIEAEHAVAVWAKWLRCRMPGAAIFAGLHTDQGRIHAHALVFIPRRGAPDGGRGWLEACATTWHQRHWPRGLVWLKRYTPNRLTPRRTASQHGAPVYAGREVGTVMMVGTAPHYKPRRRRKGGHEKGRTEP